MLSKKRWKGDFDQPKLMVNLCDQMSDLISSFWWSQLDKENKLTLSKDEGDLGFRDMHAMFG